MGKDRAGSARIAAEGKAPLAEAADEQQARASGKPFCLKKMLILRNRISY
jgi:hypothetical protein